MLYGLKKCNHQPSVNHSNIKDPWSRITITNTILMKKLELLRELPKCDPETRSEQTLLEKMALIDFQGCHKLLICTKCSQYLWSTIKWGLPVIHTPDQLTLISREIIWVGLSLSPSWSERDTMQSSFSAAGVDCGRDHMVRNAGGL